MTLRSAILLFSLGFLTVARGAPADPQKLLETTFRSGQPLTIEGQNLYVERIANGKLVLTPPLPRTESIGAFITPVNATASSAQDAAGRSPARMIDGSGWGETYRGSGVYVHTADLYSGGTNMWNGAGNTPNSWVQFDLGKEYSVAGFYFWNYNEPNYTGRGVQDLDVLASPDAEKFAQVGSYKLDQSPGSDDYKGQTVKFGTPVKARFIRFNIKSSYKSNDVAGISEVRFADADALPTAAGVVWKPTYPRPAFARQKLREPLARAENIVFPADMGIVDASAPPYNAKGDGVTDDTAAIQRALDNHPNQGAIIYLPNGVYLLTGTLRWPSVNGDADTVKNTVLQGQSRAGTVLLLQDNAPGFDVPRRPRAVLYTGKAPAQRFGNEVRNLTVDTGSGNPGACGLQFMANNQGGVYDVTVQSGDGQGVIGVDMAYTDEEGPLLVKNVSVQGFDVGIATATTLASETLEHIALLHQNAAGLRNSGQVVSIRDLRSTNRVPAVFNSAGTLTLIDAKLSGGEGAVAAMVNEAAMLLRNVQSPGYRTALEDKTSGKSLSGPVAEFRVPAPTTLLAPAQTTLGLPVEETPAVPWDDLAQWLAPQKFGAKVNDGQDDSAAIQQAIDSGATTVYLPRGEYHIGHTISLRGKLRRLIGGKANLVVIPPLKNQDAPVFRFEDGPAPVVAVERLSTDFADGPFCFMEHAAKRTLVLHALMVNFQGPPAYRNTGSGPLFIEDMVGQAFSFKGQTVWARQFNSELNFHPGTHVLNDGGKLWALGFKTEGGGTQVETRHGGDTEILGGLIGDTNAGKAAPMFVNLDSNMSVTVAEVCFNQDPFDKFVSETRLSETKLWRTNESLSGMRPVFYEGRATKP